MEKKDKLKKICFSEENSNFICELEEFKEEKAVGKFKGILVNMQSNKPAKGLFRFKKGSMKNNDGKKLFLQYNHNGNQIPVGTLIGHETDRGFEVEGQFHLQKDEQGHYINQEAAKLYSFMKDLGVKFEMSVGGVIKNSKEYSENGKYVIEILEFQAYEGSLTPRGAVEGSKVTEIFKEKENIGGEKMDKEQLEILLKGLLESFKKDMLNAGTSKEVEELPTKFNELKEAFEKEQANLEKELKESFNKQLEDINDVIKGLKVGFKATEEEVDEATQFKAILLDVNKNGQKVETVFSDDTAVNFSEILTGDGKTASTTGQATIKTTLVGKILERIQESNPVLKDINFVKTEDGSITIPREMAGLPETGWVGETSERTETSVSKVESVTVNIYQLYALPVVTNKLLATNYVGYATFLLKRVEYALGLALADAVFNGSGTNMPLGILNDSKVTNKMELDTTADDKFIDAIINIYYSVDDAVAKNAKWYLRRETWQEIAKLKNKNKDFYITDLNTGNARTLMTRPVEFVESENAGIKKLADATAGTDVVIVFGNVSQGILGLENRKMTMKLEDQLTSKGLTKYYLEKGVGVGVQLPEYFVKVVKKA